MVELARRILLLERREEMVRLILTDCDLKGRDVVTLICQTQAVDLFEHQYIEKLAD